MNFADSNIILYSLLAEQSLEKHAVAISLLKSVGVTLSTQVIGEVSSVLTRKTSLSDSSIKLIAEDLLDAFSIREEYHFSFWDSLIVATALRSEASVLYTEDTHDGLVIRNRLTIRNPFL